MTKDEFVELHGEDVWKELVEPIQKTNGDELQRVRKNNANALAHHDSAMQLCFLLNAMTFTKPPIQNLIEARVLVTEQFGPDVWINLFESVRTIFLKSKGVYLPPPVAPGQIPFRSFTKDESARRSLERLAVFLF